MIIRIPSVSALDGGRKNEEQEKNNSHGLQHLSTARCA
jgi:hypothetical protein